MERAFVTWNNTRAGREAENNEQGIMPYPWINRAVGRGEPTHHGNNKETIIITEPIQLIFTPFPCYHYEHLNSVAIFREENIFQ